MRKSLSFLAVVLIAACASQSNNSNAPAEPQIGLEQLSSAPVSAEHMTGGIPVQFRMSVTNTAAFPITLKRLDIQSMGSGGYNVAPTTVPFNVAIGPGDTGTVEFWVPGYAATSVAGVNGAVALRLMTQFDSPSGVFQTVSVRQVIGRN